MKLTSPNAEYKGKTIILLFLLMLICGCGNRQPQTSKLAPEDFYKFQKLFYSDSLFQMSRIKFPLASDLGDSSTNDLADSKIHEWNRGNWIMFRNPFFKEKDSFVQINGHVYKRKIIKDKTRIVESIYIEDSGFNITIKFSLQNGKWYLIDYTECNN